MKYYIQYVPRIVTNVYLVEASDDGELTGAEGEYLGVIDHGGELGIDEVIRGDDLDLFGPYESEDDARRSLEARVDYS